MWFVVLHNNDCNNSVIEAFTDKYNALFYQESYIHDWLDKKCGIDKFCKKIYNETTDLYGRTVCNFDSNKFSYLMVTNHKFPNRLYIFKKKLLCYEYHLDIEVVEGSYLFNGIDLSCLDTDMTPDESTKKNKISLHVELKKMFPVPQTGSYKVTVWGDPN